MLEIILKGGGRHPNAYSSAWRFHVSLRIDLCTASPTPVDARIFIGISETLRVNMGFLSLRYSLVLLLVVTSSTQFTQGARMRRRRGSADGESQGIINLKSEPEMAEKKEQSPSPKKLSRRQQMMKTIGLTAYKIALFNTSAQNLTNNASMTAILERKWRQELAAKRYLEDKIDRLQLLMNETLHNVKGAEAKKEKEKHKKEHDEEEENQDASATDDDDDTESKHDWKSLDRKLRERIPE